MEFSRLQWWSWSAAAVLVCMTAETSAAERRVRYDGHSVVRARMQDAREYERARRLSVDLLSDREGPGIADFLVGPGGLAAWRMSGLDHRVTVDDLQTTLELERLRIESRRASGTTGYFEEYRELEEIYAWFGELADAHPERSELHEIGRSLEDRPIFALEVWGQGRQKPVILMNGTIHAREWLSPTFMSYLARALVEDYAEDEELAYILDRSRVFIIPVINPDGYAYSWTHDRLWRKNRREDYGVDINRNFAKDWGVKTKNSGKNSNFWPGESAFSEPESQAVRDFFADYEVIGFIDWHTPISEVACPFLVEASKPVHHAQWHEGWAKAMAATISAVHGQNYTACGTGGAAGQGGMAMDWFADEVEGRGAMSWLVEMRGPGFEVGPEAIIPNAEENMAGFVDIVTKVATEFGIEGDGDDGDDGDTESESAEGASSDESADDESSETSEDDASSQSDASEDESGEDDDSSSQSDASSEDEEADDEEGEETESPGDDGASTTSQGADAIDEASGCRMTTRSGVRTAMGRWLLWTSR